MIVLVSLRRMVVGCVVLFLMAGCVRGPAGKTAHVEGTVKLDGKPLANVSVQFLPDSEDARLPGSGGLTDANGHFVLVASDGRDGAVIGKHHVLVHGERADERSKNPGTEKKVPEIYTKAGTANPLGIIEVTEGRPSYDFDLKSQAGGAARPAGRDLNRLR